MSDAPNSPPVTPPATPPTPGTIGWIDLTVPDAAQARDFYRAVVGWDVVPVSMSDEGGDYEDFCMVPPGAEAPVAGVCHKRGSNAAIPSTWMMYVVVADLDASLGACTGSGGTVLAPAKAMPGHGRYAIVQDPAGAAFALFEPEGG